MTNKNIPLIINATQVTEKMSGLGIVAKNISEGIIKNWDTGTIYTQYDCFKDINLNWKIKKVRFVQRDSVRITWVQTILPFLIPKNAIFYCPNIESPAFIPNKSVIVVHDLIPLQLPEMHSVKIKMYYKNIFPIILKKASYIICISESTKKHLLKFYPQTDVNKIKIIYNGYNRNLFNTNIGQTEIDKFKQDNNLKKYILYVGRISVTKNLMTLIKGFEKILNETNEDLVIVGKNESNNIEKILDYVKKNNFGDRVKYISFLNDRDLAIAYKGAEIFVLPSFYEGFGLPVIESMACGTPVIVSNTDTLLEVAKDYGMSFETNDYEDLSQKMISLLKDDSLRTFFKQKSLERSSHFDWSKSISGTLELLNDLRAK